MKAINNKNNPNSLAQMDLPMNPLTGASYSTKYWVLYEQRKKLAVWQHKEQFMQLMDQPNVQFILLEAETGSGKTTQIPQWCVEWLRKTQPHSRQMVCCTQPRRLATLEMAKRVAKEMDVQLGQEVGYSMRFEEAVSFQTVLKYCTDGVLLSEATRNNQLDQYGIIVLDEVHERTMTTDVMMGLVKQIATTRKELCIVVMSATLKAGNFRNYFDKSRRAELNIPGRNFPVDIIHASPYTFGYSPVIDSNYCEMAIAKVKEVHTQERNTPGDILLFMTGEEDIENVCDALNDWQFGPFVGELRCLPLYSALRNDQQHLIFEKSPPPTPGAPISRRCIVATNIAETSMTIEGVVFVIDPGFCKRKQFDPKTRIESLLVQSISQASAIQRAGRAGRTRPGKCFRLYTEQDFKKMKPVEPEIQHSNLANVVLRVKKCGVPNLAKFDFMDAPPPELLAQAITLLTHLEAFDVRGYLTPLGTKMADLPVDPPLARMLIESIRLECSREVITITAMLSSQNCFNRPRKKQAQADLAKSNFTHDDGDHLTLLRVFNSFSKNSKEVEDRKSWCNANFLNYRSLQYAADICNQLEEVMKRRLGIEIVSANPTLPSSTFKIMKALVAGSFMKVAFFKSTSQGVNPRAKQGHYVLVESLISEKKSLPPVPSSTAQQTPEYQIHPNSVLFRPKVYGMRPDCVLYEQAIQLKGGKHYLRGVSAIRPEWLMELAPKYYGPLRSANEELQRMLPVVETEDETRNRLLGFFRKLTM